MNNGRVFLKRVVCSLQMAVLVSTVVAQVPLNTPLDPDPAVRIGKLENGLTYYIRQNKKPEQKVELRLALNVGSINEDDDQQGLAHMAEHMAFNGTKNFKKNEIVSFLQDIGVGFGSDLNAYTSFDETVYILPIPTDKPGNLEKGFQVLEDWAHQVTYLDEDIESERSIILEESRLGKGAQDRMLRQIYPKLFAGSRYANRLPIGVDSIIRHFKPDAIRRFYKDWYRPDLMAVAVVGDIHPDSAFALIRKHFSGLENPASARKREFVSIPPYAASEAILVTDKEATSYSISVNYPIRPAAPEKTVGDYRKGLVRQLLTNMLNQRLQELTQQPNPPFVGAATGIGHFIRGHENFRAFAGVGSGDVKRGLEALTAEIERAKRFGFTPAELERVKKSSLSSMERMYNNRDKTESSLYVDEYVRNFLTGELMPGIEKEFSMTRDMLPGITLEEVNQLMRSVAGDSNRLVYVTGPQAGNTTAVPAPESLLTAMLAVERSELKPYEEKAVAASLMRSLPKAGKVVKRTEDKVMGATRLVFSNGVTVTLKQTDFKNDQVLMAASRAGGKNYYGVADRYNVEYGIQAITAMGVGEFTPTDLRKALAGKSVSVSPVMGEFTDGFNGSAGNNDIETMLQLVYLYVTAPRKDTALFRSFVQRNMSQFASIASNPQTAFIDTLFSVMYNNNPLAPIAVPRSGYFQQLNADRIVSIYKERLGDASGMHFAVVGSFKTDSIIPLLETYIGSLPSSKKQFVVKDNNVRPVKGEQKLVVNKGQEQKSLILSFYTGEIAYSQDLELKAQAIAELLNIRIIEELREKIQGIYGGGFYASVEKLPYQNYSLVLQLPCGPEKVDTLLKAANAEIEALMEKGPGQSYLDKVKKQWIEQYKTGIKENSTWLSALMDQQSQQKDAAYFLQYEQKVQALTAKDIQLAAKKLFGSGNRFTAVLMPQTAGSSGSTEKKAF